MIFTIPDIGYAFTIFISCVFYLIFYFIIFYYFTAICTVFYFYVPCSTTAVSMTILVFLFLIN